MSVTTLVLFMMLCYHEVTVTVSAGGCVVGIQLRKVEERRLKSAHKHRPPMHLDVQSLMEAAFELRRKALEDNDSDFDDGDEHDGTWSDVD